MPERRDVTSYLDGKRVGLPPQKCWVPEDAPDWMRIRYHNTVPEIKERSFGLMNDMVCYYKNIVVTEEQCKALENTGAAHVSHGASGGDPNRLDDKGIVGHDPNNAYVIMVDGPGNCWIETVEGNCPACSCPARFHTKNYRKLTDDPIKWSMPSSWDYGTLCTGCGGCTRDIPHGSVSAVLG